MNIKSPKLLWSQNQEDSMSTQEQYLCDLKQSLLKIVTNLDTNMLELDQKYMKRQEAQNIISKKEKCIENIIQENQLLKNENNQLKANIDQQKRLLKRSDMKISLLQSQIDQLSKSITEKAAIIKYLEVKAYTKSKVKQTNHDEDPSYQNISFARLKNIDNLRYENYGNVSINLQEFNKKIIKDKPTKAKHIKTQPDDTKENKQHTNIRQYGTSTKKLTDFCTTKNHYQYQNQNSFINEEHQRSFNHSFSNFSKKKLFKKALVNKDMNEQKYEKDLKVNQKRE